MTSPRVLLTFFICFPERRVPVSPISQTGAGVFTNLSYLSEYVLENSLFYTCDRPADVFLKSFINCIFSKLKL